MSKVETISGENWERMKSAINSLVNYYADINNEIVEIRRTRFRTDSEVTERQLASIASGFEELTKEIKSLKESRKKIKDDVSELHLTMAKLTREIKNLKKYEFIMCKKEEENIPKTKKKISKGSGKRKKT